jgi:hypothetical protein
MHATYPAHILLFDLIALKILNRFNITMNVSDIDTEFQQKSLYFRKILTKCISLNNQATWIRTQYFQGILHRISRCLLRTAGSSLSQLVIRASPTTIRTTTANCENIMACTAAGRCNHYLSDCIRLGATLSRRVNGRGARKFSRPVITSTSRAEILASHFTRTEKWS